MRRKRPDMPKNKAFSIIRKPSLANEIERLSKNLSKVATKQ